MSSRAYSRRQFFAGATAAAVGARLAASAVAAAPLRSERSPKVIAFTKPFRDLNARQTAELVEEIGWDGVELPVRSKDGQVHPDKVAEELPLFFDALRARGKELSIITTEITEVNSLAEKVLRTASKLGVKRYRLGFYRYAADRPIAKQLAEIAPRLKDLAALNKALDLQAGFQNHSGNGYVGAPIWDVWTMIRDLDPAQMGYCFDIGHATLEAGQSWPTNFRLVQDRLTAVFVKDFYWSKGANGWKPTWCPFGEGMVSASFFKMLKASSFSGPICQHHEYDWKLQPKEHYRQDLATLKMWLKQSV